MPADKKRWRKRRRGYSLVEVMVALAILLFGIIGVLRYFPPSLRATSEASLRGRAALLAQQKVEELRRDTDKAATVINQIRVLPQPTEPVPFSEDDRLVYQFSSHSLFHPPGSPDDPGSVEDNPRVPRVIVRYNQDFRPDEPINDFDIHPAGDVLVELRFDL